MMSAQLLRRCLFVSRTAAQRLRTGPRTSTKPATGTLCAGTLADLVRGMPQLIAENALLRQQLIILSEAHLLRVLWEYVAYYNTDRPHQGLRQRIPDPPVATSLATGTVCATPVLGRLHHAYARAA